MRIGRERARQLLADQESTFQRTKTWKKESPDPVWEATLARIETVRDEHPNRSFAFGEVGPLTCAPTPGAGGAPKGTPTRLPANYHKLHEVRQFHGCYPVADDRL